MAATTRDLDPEALSLGQRAVLAAIEASELADLFYFSGGSALQAAYLRHRTSLDLDFFSRNPVRTDRVLAVFRDASLPVSDLSRVHDRLEMTVAVGDESVRVEFVHYAFDRVAGAEAHFGRVEIDSRRDMLANKLSALIDRFEPKDYADTLLLLRDGLSLDQAVADCRMKFGWPALEHLLQQAFARSARLAHWPALAVDLTLEDAKAAFRELARDLIRLPDED